MAQQTQSDRREFRIAGFPWQLVAVISIMVLSLVGLVLKTMGVF